MTTLINRIDLINIIIKEASHKCIQTEEFHLYKVPKESQLNNILPRNTCLGGVVFFFFFLSTKKSKLLTNIKFRILVTYWGWQRQIETREGCTGGFWRLSKSYV